MSVFGTRSIKKVTQDEFREAMRMVGLSRKEQNYLWEENGWK